MHIQTKKMRVRSGFSMIEIMIAIAVIAILGAIVGYSAKAVKASASKTAATASLKAINNNIELFNSDTGEYPESLDDLVRPPVNEAAAKGWNGPYLKKKDLIDPWSKKKFVYKLTPEGEHLYELYSNGPKGTDGQKAKRISVWDL